MDYQQQTTTHPGATARTTQGSPTRRQIERHLRAKFPSMSSSMATRIARHHRTIAEAEHVARLKLGVNMPDLPRCAYRGPDPTGNLAVANVMAGGAA